MRLRSSHVPDGACWLRRSVGMRCCASAVLDETEESGWKNIHGEVFRFPPNKNLFCAFVGSGFQVGLHSQPCLSQSCNSPLLAQLLLRGAEQTATLAYCSRLFLVQAGEPA